MNRVVFVYHARSQGFFHRSQFGFIAGVVTEIVPHDLHIKVEGYHNRDKDCCFVMLERKRNFSIVTFGDRRSLMSFEEWCALKICSNWLKGSCPKGRFFTEQKFPPCAGIQC